jgi:hypothetical protein
MSVSSFRLRWRYLKSSLLWWFGLIWAVVGITFVIVALFLGLGEQRFSQGGVSTTGTILEKGYEETIEVGDRDDDDVTYWLLYRYYDADEQEYVGQEDVSLDTWNRYREGDTVTIEYLRDDPGESRVADDGGVASWLLPAIFGGVGVFLGGIGGFLTVRSFRRAGRRARTLRNGVPTQGRVIAVLKKTSVKVNGRHPFYLTYEFTDYSGQRREGESPLLPQALESRWRADEPIQVLYDRDDPSQHEVDLFEVRGDDLAAASSGVHVQHKKSHSTSSGRHHGPHDLADEIEDAFEGEEAEDTSIDSDAGGGENFSSDSGSSEDNW